MNTITKELLTAVKAQPAAVERTRTHKSINSNTITEVVAAVTARRIKVWGLWISGRNDHASAVLVVTLQDDADTPNVFAKVFIGPTSQVNGFVNLAETPFYTDAGKKLNCVTATGTANTVSVIAVTSIE